MSKPYSVGGSIKPAFLDEKQREVGDNRSLYIRSSHQHSSYIEVQFDSDTRVTVNGRDLIKLIEAVMH